MAIFLDDGWAIVQDRESCRVKALAVRGDLYNAGFVVKEEKSVWEPTQVLDWLGIRDRSLFIACGGSEYFCCHIGAFT